MTEAIEKMLTLIPAYGRDYDAAAKVLTDWKAARDFKIQDISCPSNGAYINCGDALRFADLKGTTFRIRYRQLQDIVMIRDVGSSKFTADWQIVGRVDETTEAIQPANQFDTLVYEGLSYKTHPTKRLKHYFACAHGPYVRYAGPVFEAEEAASICFGTTDRVTIIDLGTRAPRYYNQTQKKGWEKKLAQEHLRRYGHQIERR